MSIPNSPNNGQRRPNPLMNPNGRPPMSAARPHNPRPAGAPVRPRTVTPGNSETQVLHQAPRRHNYHPMQQGRTNNTKMWIMISIIGAIVLIGGGIGCYFLLSDSKTVKEQEYDYGKKEVGNEERVFSAGDRPAQMADPNGETDPRFTDFSWLSERPVTYSDLNDLSPSRLRILRNAIFARHGYMFKSDDLREYFGRYDWYEPRYVDVNRFLSTVELENIATIKRYE